MREKFCLLAAAATGALLMLAAEAEVASTPAASEAATTVFTPDDFAQYAPQTALDMVQRLPGFAITREDDGQRGFGQASGNVLINGQRVSGKSNGAVAALGRIPASRVTRIELAPAEAFGISGLTGRVANVVTDGRSGVSGTWSWQGLARDRIAPSFTEASVALSGGEGALTWTFEADNEPERRRNFGPRDVRDGTGALIERRLEEQTQIIDTLSVSGSLSFQPASGFVGNLNTKAALSESDTKLLAKTFSPVNGEGRRLFEGAEDEWSAEIGADAAFGAGPGRLKLIGLLRLERSPSIDRFVRGNLNGTGLAEQDFRQTIDEGEYILRGEYRIIEASGHEWTASAEGAFNFLEAGSTLRESSGGGPLLAVPLETSNTRVEEVRSELLLGHTRAIAPDWSLQLSIGAEQSEISQSGDTAKVRRFTRPKGFASLSWQPSSRLKLVSRIERTVGQLDFFDFVSSVDFSDENQNAGNPEIVPSQSWDISLRADAGFGAWGAAKVELIRQEIEDIVDSVPVGTGEGPGNLDRASADIADLTATLKLAPAGLDGAELRFAGRWVRSAVEDPLTGLTRGINGDLRHRVSLEFRHDIPQTDFAWGARIEQRVEYPFFRRDEIQRERGSPGFGSVYLEHKDLRGLTGQIAVLNAFNQIDRFDRQVFAPDRLGSLRRRESYRRERGYVFTVGLRGSF